MLYLTNCVLPGKDLGSFLFYLVTIHCPMSSIREPKNYEIMKKVIVFDVENVLFNVKNVEKWIKSSDERMEGMNGFERMEEMKKRESYLKGSLMKCRMFDGVKERKTFRFTLPARLTFSNILDLPKVIRQASSLIASRRKKSCATCSMKSMSMQSTRK